MTILDASIQVLRAVEGSLSAREILQRLETQGLYKFGAKDPLKVLSATIRKETAKGGTSRIVELEKGRYGMRKP